MTSNQGWQTVLTGYVQVDSIAWSQESVDELDPSTGRPLSLERFLIRRGRVRVETRRGPLSASLELDGNTIDGPGARIAAAQVGYAFPARGEPRLTVSAGLFRVPFGAEVALPDRVKVFMEPPAFARGMFPGAFDAGAMAQGRLGAARWAVAVVNGAMVGDTQWRGRDPSSSYDLVGRIGAGIDGPRKFRVEAGVSALAGSGLSPGAPPTKDGLQWVDENQDGIVQSTELHVIPGTPGTPSQSFDRDALGADVQLHWCLCKIGTGSAFAEGVIATNLDRGLVYSDPVRASRDLRQLGFAVGVLQSFGPHVQAGVRYDRYDVDRDANQRAGVDIIGVDRVFSTLAVIAAARWGEARLTAKYDHERNPFGRGDDGAPTTRRADRVSFRAQVGF
ncbi:MAG: hypothetical protein ACTHU0_16115 [Kofleriaceae bacterium]